MQALLFVVKCLVIQVIVFLRTYAQPDGSKTLHGEKTPCAFVRE
jgi:hypothetical protein